jgi:hypothetical protein
MAGGNSGFAALVAAEPTTTPRVAGRWPNWPLADWTVDAIRDPVPATRTLPLCPSAQASLPEPDPTFMAALRARGSMRPTVPIGPRELPSWLWVVPVVNA